MPTNEEKDAAVYLVVINAEEQYSIWPGWKGLPRGWKAVGKQGSKSECLAFVDEVWTDMRPASLQRAERNPPKK